MSRLGSQAALRRAVRQARGEAGGLARATRELFEAARAGDAAATRAALNSRHAPLAAKQKDEQGRSPLWLAAEAGCAECVQLLLPLSDCRACDHKGLSALQRAAERGRSACMVILAPASDVASASKDHDAEPWMTPLHWAAQQGDAAAARALASAWAAQRSKKEAEKEGESCEGKARQARWSRESMDRHAEEALELAAGAGSLDCVKIIARLCPPARGAAAGTVAIDALLRAVDRGHAEVARFLLGLSPLDRTGPHGHTALAIAACSLSAGHQECLALLLDAERERGLNSANIALWHAGRNRNAWAVRALLPLADPAWRADAKNLWQGDPKLLAPNALMAAVSKKSEAPAAETVALLARAFDPAAQNKEGQTAFDLAIQNEAFDAADLLGAWEPPEKVRAAVAAHGSIRLPRSRAGMEALEIERAARPGTSDQPKEGPADAQAGDAAIARRKAKSL